MAIKKHIKKGSGIRQQQWCCPPEGVHDCMSYNYGNPVTGFLAHEYFQIFYISNQWTPHPPYGGFFGSVTDTKFAEFGVDKPANYQMGYLQYQSESSGWGDGWYGNLQNVVNGGIYKMSINSNVLSQMNFKLYFIHPCVGRIEIPNNFNSSESNVVYFQLSNNPSFLPQLAPSDEVIPINKPGGGTPPDAIGPGIGHMDIPLPDFGEMETDPSGPGLGPPPPIPQRPPSIAGPISPGTSEIVPDIQVKPSPGSIDHLGFTDEPLYPNQCNCGNFPGVFSCGEFVPTSVWNPDIHYGSTLNQAVTSATTVDSSYGATYWPWVQVLSNETGKYVYVPASTVVPGVYASNDRLGAEWFAPAGFNRGGVGGVIQTERKLSPADRDKLYLNKINPIAQFPGNGTVIFGQKTLQTKATALDRVNVRRLLIELKRVVGNIGNTLLFEQNTAATRNRFLNQVNPYLESVQQRQGLFAYRVVMDDTNNTADVIDRNQMVGQIFIQPTKTAEYIVLDFNVTPTGVEF